MSVTEWVDCPTCGGEIRQKPYFPEGKEYCIWVGRCGHCGHSINTPSELALASPDYSEKDILEVLAQAREWERKLAEAEHYSATHPVPIGVPAEDDVHRCKTCIHYAHKGGFGFGGIAIYCMEHKQFLIDNKARLIRNQDNDCESWCPVIKEAEA